MAAFVFALFLIIIVVSGIALAIIPLISVMIIIRNRRNRVVCCTGMQSAA